MKNVKKNVKYKNSGFTLIELLAVIIILGILMIIAIPSVTTYISNSRKSAYVNTAKEIISGARNFVNEGKISMYDPNATYYLPSSCISTENGQKSPYGDFDQAYVLVTYDGNGYNYYWVSRDTTGQGVKDPVSVSVLSEDDIESNIAFDYITTNKPVEGKGNIQLLSDSDCKTFTEQTVVSNLSNAPICKRATVLHTAICEEERFGCNYQGMGAYDVGDTITYGNQNTTNGVLTAGDAFDCDVNNDGEYDSATERFYYVASNGNNAVLIYYNNVSGGVSNNTATFAYDSSGENWHGPRTAYEQLPSTTQWSNQKIIAPGTRQITNETGGTTTNNGANTIESFTYTGKAARLLTYQEIQNICNYDNMESECLFLIENTLYDHDVDLSNITPCYYYETPNSNYYDYIYGVGGYNNPDIVGGINANNNDSGIRPVIEVLKSDMEY